MVNSEVTASSRSVSPAEAQALDTEDHDDDNSAASETYAFRLFAPRIASNDQKRPRHPSLNGASSQLTPDAASQDPHTQTQHIRLNTPPITSHDNPSISTRKTAQKRPLSYYLAASPTAAQRREYETAAISGDAIRLLSKRPCPGLRYPWRVILIQPSSAPRSTAVQLEESERGGINADSDGRAEVTREVSTRSRRTRLGKKARLKIRRKMQAVRAKEEARLASERAKEQTAREKEEKIRQRNKKRNREKQLKKREREREKRKAEAEQPVAVMG